MNRKDNPLYLQVKEQILQQLLEQDLRIGDKLPTEAMLAAAFDTSRTTVKRALDELVESGLIEKRAGSGSYVLPRLLQLKQEIAANKMSKRVAFIAPNISDLYSYGLLQGIYSQIEVFKYDLVLYTTFNRLEKEQDAIERALAGKADGIILWPTARYGSSELLRKIVHQNYPIVLVDHELKDLDCHCIMSDHMASGYIATRYLLQHGHRHIGFIATSITLAPSQLNRLRGYWTALEEQGVTVPVSMQQTNLPPSETDHFDMALRQYFEHNPELTALICNGGLMLRVVEVLESLGKKVPDHVSIVCFDGFENAKYTVCPPTHVRQAEREIGIEAVKLLQQLFDKPDLASRVVQFPVKIVEGKTVRDIRKRRKFH